MNTNMTRVQKPISSCSLDESRLGIARVNMRELTGAESAVWSFLCLQGGDFYVKTLFLAGKNP